jgi:anti-anti-sigma factor
MMGLQISVLTNEDEQMVVCMLVGSLDTETYQKLKDKVATQLKKTPKVLVLDLKSLEYISSMGISAVLEVRKSIEAIGGRFMMSNVPVHIDQVFKIVNALPDVPMFESREEADKYFLAIQKKIKGE